MKKSRDHYKRLLRVKEVAEAPKGIPPPNDEEARKQRELPAVTETTSESDRARQRAVLECIAATRPMDSAD